MKYKILSLTPPVKKDNFDMSKVGLIVEDEIGNKIGGSIYSTPGKEPKLSVGDIVYIEEIKVNKDRSHTFRGVSKIDNDSFTPLLF